MKKRLTRILSLFMALAILTSVMCAPASAQWWGYNDTASFTADTSAGWWITGSPSVTLTQRKVVATYRGMFNSNKKKTRSYYPVYNVTIRGNGRTETKKFNSGSLKIKLAKNQSYTITVSYDSTATFFKSCNSPFGYIYDSETSANWWVKNTWKTSVH